MKYIRTKSVKRTINYETCLIIFLIMCGIFPSLDSQSVDTDNIMETDLTEMPNPDSLVRINNFPKCCPHGQHLLDVKNSYNNNTNLDSEWTCTPIDQSSNSSNFQWLLSIFSSPYDSSPTEMVPLQSYKGLPHCPNKNLSLVNGEEVWFRILENGEIVVGLHFWFWPMWLPASGEYCVDFELQKGRKNYSEVLVFCSLEGYNLYIAHRTMYGLSLLTSAFFALVTLLIYFLAGRNCELQVSNFLALFLFGTVEGTRIFMKLDGLNIKLGKFCFYYAIISQYFSIVVVATLTVMGLDLLWTFWKLETLAKSSRRPKRKLFLGIGIPWIVPLIGLVGGLLYNHYTNPQAPKQEMGIFEFGHDRCSSPAWDIGAAINTTLFIITSGYFVAAVFIIFKQLYTSRFAKNTSTSTKTLTAESFGLLLKIALLGEAMNIGAVTDLYFGKNSPGAWYWAVSRILCWLQGLWLFFVFGCTKQNRRILWKKFPVLQRISPSSGINNVGSRALPRGSETTEVAL